MTWQFWTDLIILVFLAIALIALVEMRIEIRKLHEADDDLLERVDGLDTTVTGLDYEPDRERGR